MKAALLVLLFASRAHADARGDLEAMLEKSVVANMATSEPKWFAQDYNEILILPQRYYEPTATNLRQELHVSIALDATKKRAWFHGRIAARYDLDGTPRTKLWQLAGMAVDTGTWKLVGLMITAPSPALTGGSGYFSDAASHRGGDPVASRLVASWIEHDALAAHAQSTAIAFGPKGHERDVASWRLKLSSLEAIRSGPIAFVKARVHWQVAASTDAVAYTLGVILVEDRWVVLGLAGD